MNAVVRYLTLLRQPIYMLDRPAGRLRDNFGVDEPWQACGHLYYLCFLLTFCNASPLVQDCRTATRVGAPSWAGWLNWAYFHYVGRGYCKHFLRSGIVTSISPVNDLSNKGKH